MNKVRFLKASAFHQEFLKRIYAENPDLKYASYDTQYRSIMQRSVAWSDFWKKNLEKIGTYQCEELCVNAEHLQKTWAKEHKINYSEKTWTEDILEAQIKEFKPDIFFSHDFTYIKTSLRLKIKAIFPKVIIIGWDGVAKNDPARFEGCDLMLSCVQSVADFYRTNGFTSYFFPFGFETSVLDKIKSRKKPIDISFIGSITLGNDNHKHRLKLISYLVEHTNIEIRMPRFPRWPNIIKQNLIAQFYGKKTFWNDLPDIYKIKKRASRNQPCFGLDMYQALADSKITINAHINSIGPVAANMRLFEATGVGTCLLTDAKENITDYFIPDKEILTYSTPEECLAKVQYLLSHNDDREQIARAGQEKTLTLYSFEQRMRDFSNFLMNEVL